MASRIGMGVSRARFPAWRWIAAIIGVLLFTRAYSFVVNDEALRPSSDALRRTLPSRLPLHENPVGQKPLAIEPSRLLSGENGPSEQSWGPDRPSEPSNALAELHGALEAMQKHYFELWLGTWPSAIDWTAAVMGTYVAGTLQSLTRSLSYILPGTQSSSKEGQRVENEINKYFSQDVAYYFGENAFSLRMQAYDDMLWVVLGWLENIKFIQLHDRLHYPSSSSAASGRRTAWYGKQFEPSFAHRAHIFYSIASQGWDTELCGGGMTWNPRLEPYKNAITNELFISASVGMYLYFPGDDNRSPFIFNKQYQTGLPPATQYDPQYLKAAVDGYDWLVNSNMTNKHGLFVDGFHIHGWGKNGTIGTGKCDRRNEMVYTYNQGVIISGLRGLWEATGRITYLEDGHQLVRNVIKASGYDLLHRRVENKKWGGLGRNGILEEICDASGSCSQNAQTFKGIFFHHLTLFCEPLPRIPVEPGKTYAASPVEAMLHAQSCKEYAPWVAYNAQSALQTRDEEGRFGTWWGEPLYRDEDVMKIESPLPNGAVDYRNNDSLPVDRRWMSLEDGDLASESVRGEISTGAGNRGDGRLVNIEEGDISSLRFHPCPHADKAASLSSRTHIESVGQRESAGFGASTAFDQNERPIDEDEEMRFGNGVRGSRDANDRGRGRTVETQGGGVAVIRAMWELVNMYR